MKKLAEHQQVYRPIYAEILAGFSSLETMFLKENKQRTYYIKHLKESDYGELESRAILYEAEAKESGLLTEEESLQSFHEMGVWTEDDEADLSKLQKDIDNLKVHISSALVASQRKPFEEELRVKKKKLEDLLPQRNDLFTITVESFVEKKKSEEILRFSFYDDSEFKKMSFSEEDYGELTHTEYAELIESFNKKMAQFSDYHISRLALLPFYINSVFLCKSNPFIYYGKPVVELTTQQSELFSKGMFYKSVLEQGHNPPEEFYNEDLDKLISWYELKSKCKKGPQEQNWSPSGGGEVKGVGDRAAQGSSIMGATKEEMQEIGKTQGMGSVSLNDEAEKLKKELGKENLDIYDMAKLHGL